MSLCVFVGPSLPVEERIAVDGVTYAPAASRGELLHASGLHAAVLLIDGVFHHNLAPSPKETYEACRRTQLYGAASMGALRAAECAPYGALPLGVIATWYVRGKIDGDDEVAVLVNPRTQTALTVPSVNVRYVARLAVRRQVLSESEAEVLVAMSRDIFYAERRWEDVLALVPAHARSRLRVIIESEGDLKRLDARFALRSVLRRLRSASGQLPRVARVKYVESACAKVLFRGAADRR